MKKNNFLVLAGLLLAASKTPAQNIFPSTGRAGINTTTPVAALQVKGGAQFGSSTNYTSIDSATGNLSFSGNSQYRVGGNKYAFAFSGNPNYGLFFNQTNLRYEFRNGSATPVFYVGANDGKGYFMGDAVINGLTIGTGAGSFATNTALGFSALTANTSGQFNTGAGAFALNANSSGINNTATGYASLYSNTTGSTNTAFGFEPLYFNTTGSGNTATGYFSLFKNTTGSGNLANGYSSMYSNTTGSYNVALGYFALYTNNTGLYNIASGSFSMYNHSKGDDNLASGRYSLYSDTTGLENVALGFNASYLNTKGSYNTAVGSHALESNKDGSYNTFIGYKADVTAFSFTNSTAIGFASTISASNQVRIGNSSVTSIGGQVSWSTLSDGRVKRNIKADIPGLTFINKLKPVSYNLDENAVDQILQRPVITDKDGKRIESSGENTAARKAKENVVYSGFIAQDVEKAAKDLNYNFSGVDAPKNDKDLYGLRYSDFVVPLVKAVQELSAQNEELKQRLDQLEKLVSQGNATANTASSSSAVILSEARLEQNIPNPFNQQTVIRYFIPSTSGAAVLKITGINGETLKVISIQAKGSGQVTLQAGQLTSGTYMYTLYVDGRAIDSKRMVITK